MICRAHGCKVILSRYNHGTRCGIHEEPKPASHRVHRKRNGTDVPHDPELDASDREAFYSGAWVLPALPRVETGSRLGKASPVSTHINGEGT